MSRKIALIGNQNCGKTTLFNACLLYTSIQEHNPDVVLSIGQAGGRTDITVERIGINMDDCLSLIHILFATRSISESFLYFFDLFNY